MGLQLIKWLFIAIIAGAIVWLTTKRTAEAKMSGIDQYTKLFLPMNVDFADHSNQAHPVTLINTPVITAVNPLTGAGSGQFAAASQQAISFPDSADWNFGASDFTIEFYVSFNSLPAVGKSFTFFQQYNGGSNYWQMIFEHDGRLRFTFVFNGVVATVASAFLWTPDLNTRYHLVWERSGTNLLLYIDGASRFVIGTQPGAAALGDYDGAVMIGDDGFGNSLDGKLDNLRISKGIARYSSDFTVPDEFSSSSSKSSSSSSSSKSVFQWTDRRE